MKIIYISFYVRKTGFFRKEAAYVILCTDEMELSGTDFPRGFMNIRSKGR